MKSHILPSSIKLFYLLFFLSYMEISISHGSRSCSLSCGNLQNIKYPFRLSGDPVECGNPDYEFSCEGNRTVFKLPPSKYYVTHISYYELKVTLIDIGLARGNCNLPDASLSSKDHISPFYFVDSYKVTVTFINCSVYIGDSTYEIISCLNDNNSIIYAIDESTFPEQNCSILFSVLGTYKPQLFSYFDQAKLGFQLRWVPPFRSAVEAICSCAEMVGRFTYVFSKSDVLYDVYMGRSLFEKITPFRYETDFLHCLDRKKVYSHSTLTYYAVAVIFIVLDLILLKLGKNMISPKPLNCWCSIYKWLYFILAVLFLIGRFLLAPFCILSFLAYNLFKLLAPIDVIERFLQNQEALSPSRFSYNEIIIITSNFKEKLGQGGFGSVFKGRLPGGYLVAVKMLDKSIGDGEDFINEVSTIGRIHHVNIVKLVGFCAEGSYRALVYEYMSNGSLEKYIFSSNLANRFLTKEKLIEIALSVAKGLHYLHQGCDTRILHFDIKPHNILLDHKFTPKISDFGLAKLHPKGHSIVSIYAGRGTIGYMAPELVSRSFGSISHKSDVYSFGMLLMDMAGRRRHTDMKAENSSQIYYPSWIYDQLHKGEMFKDINIIEIDDLEKKLCKVGLWCIQTRPLDRPCMMKVLDMLEADVDSIQMPPKPFFSSLDQLPSSNICMDSSPCELSIISEKF